MSVFADVRFVMQDGDDYIDFGPNLTTLQTRIITTPIQTDVKGSEFPRVSFSHQRGELTVGGLLYDPYQAAKDFALMTSGGDILFALWNEEDDLVGPVGYVKLNDPQIVTPIGVIRVSNVSPGQRNVLAEKWSYGRFLPVVYNANRLSSNSDYFEAPEGARIVLNVVDAGSMTALEVSYTIGGTAYSIAANLDSGAVVPQLKLARMVTSADVAIPSQAAGTWRISATGSTSDAEIYVGVLD